MDVYLVCYESLRNDGRDNRQIGVCSTLERARRMAETWLQQRYGYAITSWPDHVFEEYGYRYWYVDIRAHEMVIKQFTLDAPVSVEPEED